MVDATTNIAKLLGAFLRQVQDLEDAYQQLLLERSLDTSVGAQLDVIGRKVGQKRNGYADEAYRRLLRARISTNRSSGLPEQLIHIALLVVNDPTLAYLFFNVGGATARLVLDDGAVGFDVALLAMIFLRIAVAGGVRLVLEFTTIAPAATFCWFGDVGLGWGDELNAATGGGWASALA